MNFKEIIKAIGINPYYQDGAVVIYHADCRDILPLIPDKSIDLVLTDPPYGIDYKAFYPLQDDFIPMVGDDGGLDLSFLFKLPYDLVIFGANNMPYLLPHKGVWLCWDKRVIPKADKVIGSQFELLWTNKTHGFQKIYRVQHGGVINDNAKNQPRLHPTEKPIRLLELILLDYPKAEMILDPFFGSGTTGMACKKLNRKCIGIEIEEKYCEIAANRCRQSVMNLNNREDRNDHRRRDNPW
jgi:site-specific DNA-methyltransferase (adenine-specific)